MEFNTIQRATKVEEHMKELAYGRLKRLSPYFGEKRAERECLQVCKG